MITNINNKEKPLYERLEEIDSEAVVRGIAMTINESSEIAGVNHSFTKNKDIEELKKHQALVSELRNKIAANADLDDF